MSSQTLNHVVGTIDLAGLIRNWEVEKRLLLEGPSQNVQSTAERLIKEVQAHPEVFAPVSMTLAAGLDSVGWLLTPLVNKSYNEASTRYRVLTQLIKLNGTRYDDLSWANTLEMYHYVGWLIQDLSKRVEHLSLIDLSLCDEVEAAHISNQRVEYEAVVKELRHCHANTQLVRQSYHRLASEERDADEERSTQFKSDKKLQRERNSKLLANVNAKEAARVLLPLEAEKQREQLKHDLAKIQSSLYCALPGCKEDVFLNSVYCKQHKCRQIGCTHHVAGVSEEVPQFVSKMLRGAMSLVGNDNTDHILVVADMFCEKHAPTLNQEEDGNAERRTSRPSKTGLSVNQTFCIAFAAIVSILFILKVWL